MSGKGDKRNYPVSRPPMPQRRITAGRRRLLVVLGGFVSVGLFVLAIVSQDQVPESTARGGVTAFAAPTTLASLLKLDSARWPDLDIARANLLAAEGLPGSDHIDMDAMLASLDRWTAGVQSETNRHLYKFQRNPGEFNQSEAYFRVLMLVTVLQQDMKVRYNPARAADPDFRDSRDLFIHGLVNGGNGGTCASMPVLYVAVGRRLGYPLKLVAAKAHLFARWEDGEERFNMEATNSGLSTPDDEYYKTWPMPIREIEAGYYLKSMTPAEELAAFMALRGDCLDANGHSAEAATAYAEACRLAPAMLPYRVAHQMMTRTTLERADFHKKRTMPPAAG